MYEYKALITRVIDGDTFDAHIELGFDIAFNATLRLKGVDTPETWRPSCLEEKAHGEMAKTEVKSLIEGKYVKLKTYGTGKYGRHICDIETMDGVNLASFIKEKGLEKKEIY
jgi:micrococcal nuclease